MLDTAFNILKVSVILAVAAVFAIAINALLTLLSAIVFGGVVGEVIGLISCCLPFDAAFVFGSISTVITGVFTFLIAKKIFDLTSWSISTA